MKTSKVLIVESNQDLRGILSLLLGRYAVVAVGDTDEADEALRHDCFDLAILDVAAAGESSRPIRFIQTLRNAGEHLPIIATSAHPDASVAVKALRAGSDDFIRKPLKSAELIARVESHIKRQHERPTSTALKAGGIYLHADFLFGRASVGADLTLRSGSKATQLLAKQYAMLWVFHQNRGKLVTREMLRREVWGPATNAGASSMTEYISRLRKSFRSIGLDFDEMVHTQSGVGYRVME
jgi:DNA-binding response OmpR family regulator